MDKYQLVIAMVNTGFTELVMDAARQAGARGGTIVHARGTGNKEIEKRFNIAITPDKEIVFIVVPEKITDDVLEAIYEKAGLKTKGQGIAFSVPVEDAVGISTETPLENKQEEEKEKPIKLK